MDLAQVVENNIEVIIDQVAILGSGFAEILIGKYDGRDMNLYTT